MPELPDIVVYVEALERHVKGEPLLGVRVASPFVLRTVSPPVADSHGRKVVGVHRLGKRIAIELDHDRFLLIHLMVSGRLRWLPPAAKVPARLGLAAFDFPPGTLLLTEASTQKRASLHVVQGRAALEAMRRPGVEPLECTAAQFARALTCENHTLKRALTDPDLFSGIGNAYSDEILHRARLSPVRLSRQLEPPEIDRLLRACRETLTAWTDKLRAETGEGFPDKVTAFRQDMAVHGRYGKPCPTCGTAVQRIRYASNEVNYCPGCQTAGRLLADRSLSRLLKGDWPRSIEQLEERARSVGRTGARTGKPA